MTKWSIEKWPLKLNYHIPSRQRNLTTQKTTKPKWHWPHNLNKWVCWKQQIWFNDNIAGEMIENVPFFKRKKNWIYAVHRYNNAHIWCCRSKNHSIQMNEKNTFHWILSVLLHRRKKTNCQNKNNHKIVHTKERPY